MAFLGLNRERLFYVLANGTQEGELKKFFTECHRLLMAKGARIQNPPHGRAARIKAICEKFPPATESVVKSWFHSNITMVDPVSVEDSISEFQLYEVAEDVLPADQATRISRSVLIHLFADDPDPKLVAFMKTRIGGVLEAAGSTQQDIQQTLESGPMEDERPKADEREVFVELLAAMASDEDTEDLLDLLPSEVSSYVSGLISARNGDVAAAEEALKQLPIASKTHARLSRNIKRAKTREVRTITASGGLQVLQPAMFSDEFDAEQDAILGYCTKADSPNAVFVKPIAIVRGSEVLFLSASQRTSIFPETGDVMAFTGANRPKQPGRGEISIWRVAEHETEKKVRFHIESHAGRVYEIARIPSSDPDSVREFVKSTRSSRKVPSLLPQLYLLEDGTVIAPKNRSADLSRDEGFEQSFSAWHGLRAIPFEGRLLVLDPLPLSHESYDCSSLSSAVKRLAKAAVEQKSVQLTSLQIRELIASFQSVDIGVETQRLHRIEQRLELLADDNDSLQAVVPLLLQHPLIKEQVSLGVEHEVRARTAENAEMQREILNLKTEKTQWQTRVKELQSQHRRAESEAAALVKAAFDKAVNNGIDALANVAVINALRDGVPAMPTIGPSSPTSIQPFVASRLGRVEVVELLERFSGLGIDRRTAAGIVEIVKLSAACGIAVAFRGLAARFVVRDLAAALGENAANVEIGIGLVESLPLQVVISDLSPGDAIGLLNADVSPLELYGSSLMDHLIERSRALNTQGPLVMLALSSSNLALPIPQALQALLISIDLDRKTDFQSLAVEDESLWAEFEERSDHGLRRNAMSRLHKHVSELDEDIRGLVMAILKSNANAF